MDRPESVKDKSDRSDEVSTPVADSLKDTAATDNKSKVHLVYALIHNKLG